MSYLLGIDVGTTNIKAIAFTEDGQVQAGASVPTPTIREGEGHAVHDPQALWDAVCRTVREVVTQVEPSRIAGMGVASVGEEGFPLDGEGNAVYPGILWYDERTFPMVGWWEREVGPERVYRITGLPIQHTFTALKLQWLAAHEPEVMQRTVHWLWVGDYIAFRLTGEMATNPSLASRSLLYDLAEGDWSAELLDLAGVHSGLLPPIVQSGTIVGTVTAGAAAATGLREGTPVAAGGHDHICGCLAAGAMAPGDVIHSAGTAEAFAIILDRAGLDERLAHAGELACGAHVLPGRYYAERGRYTGGMVGWWERLLASGGDPEELRERAAAVPVGSRGLIFVPYMYGKGPPRSDPLATGSLLGLRADHDAADILRAVVEGVCLDSIGMQRLLRAEDGGQVIVIGGLARNRLWLDSKANVLDVEIRVPEQTEAVAQGAALLAGLGTEMYPDSETMLARTLRWAEEVDPDPDIVRQYRALYQERYAVAAERVQGLIRRPHDSGGG